MLKLTTHKKFLCLLWCVIAHITFAHASTKASLLNDVTPPIALCHDTVLELDLSGQALLNAADIDAGSSDSEGSVTLSIDQTLFDCSNVGPNPVTLTVTDEADNESTCQASVFVIGAPAPIVVTKDITVELDANGTATITPADMDDNSLVSCGITSMTVTPDTFDCSNAGTNEVTLTIVDNGGNTASETATVSVVDVTAPAVLCHDTVLELDFSGNAILSPQDVDAGSADNCGIAALTVSQTQFDCSNIGSTPVTLSATDAAGNSSTCEASVFVIGAPAPIVVTKDITVELDANGTATITPADMDDNSLVSCGITSMTVTPDTFDCSNAGTNEVTLTIVDNGGNTASETATVSVVDVTAPAVLCHDTVLELDFSGNAILSPQDVDAGSADNCGIASLTVSQTQFDCSNIGSTPVTLSATDAAGNSSTCEASVFVIGAPAPIVVTKDITVELDANGTATITPADVDDNSLVSCGIASMTVTPDTFDCSNAGTNEVTLTIVDNGGNTASETATVSVVDVTAPAVLCHDTVLELDFSGNAILSPQDVDAGSADNCGIAALTVSQTQFDCSNIGSTPVTLSATDAAGNSSTCEASVFVIGAPAPIVVTKDITVELDANGTATITPADVDDNSLVSCGIASMTVTPDTFDCSNAGTNEVTLTIVDNGGNTASETATVSVVDVTAPAVLCHDTVLELDFSGNAILSPQDVDAGSADNCGIASLTVSQTQFDCSNIGSTPVTLTATDAAGNSSTCEASVFVIGAPAPIAVAKDITVVLDVNGQASITPEDIDDNSELTCGNPTLSIDINSFDCSNVGPNTVTLTVTDNGGNSNSDEAIVTVVDADAPELVCQDFQLYFDENGLAALSVDDVSGNISDACGIQDILISQTVFNSSNAGNNSVELTAIDVNGNGKACLFTVTVSDTIAPTAPTNFEATVGADSYATTWDASTDNIGVVVYNLYLDGAFVTQVTDLMYIFDNVNVVPGVTLGVSAVDAAGNESPITEIIPDTPLVLQDGIYQLVNNHSNLLAAPTSSSNGMGVHVKQYTDNGFDYLKWRIKSIGNGLYSITNLFSGLSLDVAGASTQAGAFAVQATPANVANQEFQIAHIQDDLFNIFFNHSGLAFGSDPLNNYNDANLHQQNFVDQDWQEWNLVFIDDDNTGGSDAICTFEDNGFTGTVKSDASGKITFTLTPEFPINFIYVHYSNGGSTNPWDNNYQLQPDGQGNYTFTSFYSAGSGQTTFFLTIAPQGQGQYDTKSFEYILGDDCSMAKFNGYANNKSLNTAEILVAPNPFSTTSVVSFSTQLDDYVTVDVYNMSGTKVARLYDGSLNGGTVQEIVLDGTGLSEGIYMIHMNTASGLSETIKMTHTN